MLNLNQKDASGVIELAWIERTQLEWTLISPKSNLSRKTIEGEIQGL
jgi:hypothetical protein